MESSFDWYGSVARRYRYLAEKDSPEAVTLLIEIQSTFGVHTAMRAGIAIELTKRAFQQYGNLPNSDLYRHLLENNLEAIPFVERAVAFCRPQWGTLGANPIPAPHDPVKGAPEATGFLTTIPYITRF